MRVVECNNVLPNVSVVLLLCSNGVKKKYNIFVGNLHYRSSQPAGDLKNLSGKPPGVGAPFRLSGSANYPRGLSNPL